MTMLYSCCNNKWGRCKLCNLRGKDNSPDVVSQKPKVVLSTQKSGHIKTKVQFFICNPENYVTKTSAILIIRSKKKTYNETVLNKLSQ